MVFFGKNSIWTFENIPFRELGWHDVLSRNRIMCRFSRFILLLSLVRIDICHYFSSHPRFVVIRILESTRSWNILQLGKAAELSAFANQDRAFLGTGSIHKEGGGNSLFGILSSLTALSFFCEWCCGKAFHNVPVSSSFKTSSGANPLVNSLTRSLQLSSVSWLTSPSSPEYLIGRYYAFAFTLQASRRFLWMFRRVGLRLSVLPPWEVVHPLEYWLLLFLRAIPKEDRLPSRTSHYCSSCDFRYHLKSIPREWCLSSQESVLFESFLIQISLPTVLHLALVLWTHILLQLFRIDLDIFGFQFVSPLILFQRFWFFLGLLALLGFLLETG